MKKGSSMTMASSTRRKHSMRSHVPDAASSYQAAAVVANSSKEVQKKISPRSAATDDLNAWIDQIDEDSPFDCLPSTYGEGSVTVLDSSGSETKRSGSSYKIDTFGTKSPRLSPTQSAQSDTTNSDGSRKSHRTSDKIRKEPKSADESATSLPSLLSPASSHDSGRSSDHTAAESTSQAMERSYTAGAPISPTSRVSPRHPTSNKVQDTDVSPVSPRSPTKANDIPTSSKFSFSHHRALHQGKVARVGNTDNKTSRTPSPLNKGLPELPDTPSEPPSLTRKKLPASITSSLQSTPTQPISRNSLLAARRLPMFRQRMRSYNGIVNDQSNIKNNLMELRRQRQQSAVENRREDEDCCVTNDPTVIDEEILEKENRTSIKSLTSGSCLAAKPTASAVSLPSARQQKSSPPPPLHYRSSGYTHQNEMPDDEFVLQNQSQQQEEEQAVEDLAAPCLNHDTNGNEIGSVPHNKVTSGRKSPHSFYSSDQKATLTSSRHRNTVMESLFSSPSTASQKSSQGLRQKPSLTFPKGGTSFPERIENKSEKTEEKEPGFIPLKPASSSAPIAPTAPQAKVSSHQQRIGQHQPAAVVSSPNLDVRSQRTVGSLNTKHSLRSKGFVPSTATTAAPVVDVKSSAPVGATTKVLTSPSSNRGLAEINDDGSQYGESQPGVIVTKNSANSQNIQCNSPSDNNGTSQPNKPPRNPVRRSKLAMYFQKNTTRIPLSPHHDQDSQSQPFDQVSVASSYNIPSDLQSTGSCHPQHVLLPNGTTRVLSEEDRALRLKKRQRKLLLLHHALTCTKTHSFSSADAINTCQDCDINVGEGDSLSTMSSSYQQRNNVPHENENGGGNVSKYVYHDACTEIKHCHALQRLIRHVQTCTNAQHQIGGIFTECEVPGCAAYKGAWNHYRRCCFVAARSSSVGDDGKNAFPNSDVTCALCRELWREKSQVMSRTE